MENERCLSRAPNAPKKERVVPYSLAKPPGAPKKKTVRQPKFERLQRLPRLVIPTDEEVKKAIEAEEKEEENEPEWAFLRDSGRVRHKFLGYDPRDVAVMDDKDFLETMKEWYFPASQPRNWYEEAYCLIMREAITSRISQL